MDYVILSFRPGGWLSAARTAGVIAAATAVDWSDLEIVYRRFLQELRYFMEAQPGFTSRKAAEQAALFEGGVRFDLERTLGVIPALRWRDRLFGEVFGSAGKQIIAEEVGEAKAAVLAYMAETGIEDEQEARRQLAAEYEAGLEAGIEALQHLRQSTRKEQ